jgi:hypothetical protein
MKDFDFNGDISSINIDGLDYNSLRVLIQYGLDMDEWKHSWHVELISENKAKIAGILQGKIKERDQEIKLLERILSVVQYL